MLMERSEALVGARGERRGHVLELSGGVGGVRELGWPGTRAASTAGLKEQRHRAQEPHSARKPRHGYLRHRCGATTGVRRSNEGIQGGVGATSRCGAEAPQHPLGVARTPQEEGQSVRATTYQREPHVW